MNCSVCDGNDRCSTCCPHDDSMMVGAACVEKLEVISLVPHLLLHLRFCSPVNLAIMLSILLPLNVISSHDRISPLMNFYKEQHSGKHEIIGVDEVSFVSL